MRESSKEYFDSIGAGWDRLREQFLLRERVRDVALAAAGVREGVTTAADLGAGTGFISEWTPCARMSESFAVDRSASMLEALRHGSSRGPTGWNAESARRRICPITDGSVDCCLANLLLHHVERPSVAIGGNGEDTSEPGGRGGRD